MAKDDQQVPTSVDRERRRVAAADAAGPPDEAELKRRIAAAIADGETAAADKAQRQLDKLRASED